jgi:hypothetical protein
MTGTDRSVRVGSWLAAPGWLAALALGLWIVIPVLRSDPLWFAWVTTLGVIAAALAFVFARRRRIQATPAQAVDRRALARMPPPRHRRLAARVSGRAGPNWYKGRSHSGERPQFD